MSAPPDPFEIGYQKYSRAEIAEAVGCALKDLDVWMQANPEFEKELKRGLKEADAEDVLEVEEALLKSATGYTGTRKVINRKTKAMEVIDEYIAPNQKSMEIMLERRAGDRWKGDQPPERPITPQILITVNQRLTSKGRAPIEITGTTVPSE